MKIKVAIIGCGSITEFRHAPEYAANAHAEIAAFFDHNPERAERLAGMFGGKVAPSIDAIIEDPAIDAVSVCTSNETHEEVTVKALRAGKHVLCEKPIAISVEGARAMMKAEEESDCVLMIGHNQRFSQAHVVAKRLVASGEIGKVLTFQTTFGHSGPEHWAFEKSKDSWFFSKDRSVLGAAGDLGIHKLDLIRYLLEDEIADIAAFGGALHKTDSEGEPISVNDNMVCIVKTEGGVLGTVSLSWTYYGEEDNSTTLYGEKGIDEDIRQRYLSRAAEAQRRHLPAIRDRRHPDERQPERQRRHRRVRRLHPEGQEAAGQRAGRTRVAEADRGGDESGRGAAFGAGEVSAKDRWAAVAGSDRGKRPHVRSGDAAV